MTPMGRQRLVRGGVFTALVVTSVAVTFLIPVDVQLIEGELGRLEVDGRSYPAFCPAGWPPPEHTLFAGFAEHMPEPSSGGLIGTEPESGRAHGVIAMTEPYLASQGRLLVGMGTRPPGADALEPFSPDLQGSAEIVVPHGGRPRTLSVWRIVRLPNGTAYLAAGFRDAFERHGILSPILYVAVYVLGTVILFPATILTIIGAFAFGRVWGSVWVMVGMNLGAAAAFAVGRWMGRDAVERFLPPRIAALSQKLEKRGFITILVLRLIPVCPYNLLNYGAGVTRMRFVDYFVGGLIGMTPVMILWVQATLSVTDMRLAEPLSWLPVVALGFLVLAPMLLLRVRWGKLAAGLEEGPPEPAAGSEKEETPGTG